MLKNTVYIIKSDEGKYLLLKEKPKKHVYLGSGINDIMDDPLYYYQINGVPIVHMLPVSRVMEDLHIKVFSTFNEALEFLKNHEEMQL